jgi:LPS-assembly protein
VGQSFLGDNNGLFPLSQDAGSNFSDIVAGVALDYKPVNLSYGLQLDQETLNTRRNEFNGSFTYNPVSFYTTYNSLDSSLSTDGFEEVQAGGSLKLDDNWTLTSYATRDLTEWGGWVNNGAGLTYANECITVISNVGRSFTRDRDIKPSTSFTLQVLLRNF